jgi:hypothetical protein
MNPWKDLYTELAEKITAKLSEILWVDLWHEQIQYLTEELPFPAPAVFIGFQILSMDDKGVLIQDCNTQIDLYLFFETFSDTYQGAYNQSSALSFLESLNSLHVLFHGTDGINYSSMRRIDQKREDSGGAGNLYRISFACVVEDASAKVEADNKVVNEVTINKESFTKPSGSDSEPLFSF